MNIFYYKCNKKGCRKNTNANKIHDKFQELLRKHTLRSEDKELFALHFISDKVSTVIDLYDMDKWENNRNYYGRKHKLTKENCLK